jgi:hypothetical protein
LARSKKNPSAAHTCAVRVSSAHQRKMAHGLAGAQRSLAPRPQPGPRPGNRSPAWAKSRPVLADGRFRPSIRIRRLSTILARSKPQPPSPLALTHLFTSSSLSLPMRQQRRWRRRRGDCPAGAVADGSPSFSSLSLLLLLNSRTQQLPPTSNTATARVHDERRLWRHCSTPRRRTRTAEAIRGTVERHCRGALCRPCARRRCGAAPCSLEPCSARSPRAPARRRWVLPVRGGGYDNEEDSSPVPYFPFFIL